MDGGAWWAIVHRVAKSQTRLSNLATTHDKGALVGIRLEHRLLEGILRSDEVVKREEGQLGSVGTKPLDESNTYLLSSDYSLPTLSCRDTVVGVVTIPILQMGKLRLRRTKFRPSNNRAGI